MVADNMLFVIVVVLIYCKMLCNLLLWLVVLLCLLCVLCLCCLNLSSATKTAAVITLTLT
jgi:hypothetical protein